MRLLQALRHDGEARIVGGAVRDVLLSRTIGDIDLATTLLPQKVIEVLGKHGIKTVPTGLAHGTITAVIDRLGYEITTLRTDIETDGRHARVAFTDDWKADASRRDFTFNALYVDGDGTLYDFFDGIQDAAEGRVHFIGSAEDRIHEDVLRILRFFRFYAWFGRDAPDDDALKACKKYAHLLSRLSAERVAHEVLKLLQSPHPLSSWKLLVDKKILDAFLPEATDVDRLSRLLAQEQRHGEPQAPIVRLAALLPTTKESAQATVSRLKLSNVDGNFLITLANLQKEFSGNVEVSDLRRLLYRNSAGACRAAAFLGSENGASLSTTLTVINAWENPLFPLKGQDIMKLGISTGSRVGEILKSVEEWWVESDFRASRAECLSHAETLLHAR
jgi:poly(A) polymerase